MMTEMINEPVAKFSNWRVIAKDVYGNEHLIFTGQSYSHVTESFGESFKELLEPDEKAKIKEVVVQRWNGLPNRGTWVNKKSLAIP